MADIKWLGHAAFQINLIDKTVLIDPWLNGNPKSAMKASDVKRADIVCVTHDHMDHLGDALDICKRTGGTFVGIAELGFYAKENNVENVVAMNVGGSVEIKGIEISMVQAFHSAHRGGPIGFVLKAEEKTVYHAGDTGLFGDMKLIGEIYHPDVVLLPIGGYYTMGAQEAAEAVRLIRPQTVIPMHYGTLPVLATSAEEFTKNVKRKAPNVVVMALKPGEVFRF